MYHVVCRSLCLWSDTSLAGKSTEGICPEVWGVLITANSILISVVNNSFHTHRDFSFSLTFLCLMSLLFTCNTTTYWIHRHWALRHIQNFFSTQHYTFPTLDNRAVAQVGLLKLEFNMCQVLKYTLCIHFASYQNKTKQDCQDSIYSFYC